MLGNRGIASHVPTGRSNPVGDSRELRPCTELPTVATYFVLWLVRRIVPASTLPVGDVCT